MTFTVLLITARVSLSAQTSGERGDFAFSRTETTVQDDDRIIGLDRWAFRINALELLCTVPNINIEFDLSSSPFNRWSLGLTAKYNWNTTHSVPPPLVFNMFEIRPEFRRWYRLSPKEGRSSAANERVFFVGGYTEAHIPSTPELTAFRDLFGVPVHFGATNFHFTHTDIFRLTLNWALPPDLG